MVYFPLPPVFVVVGGPFFIGPFSCILLSGIFQIIPPIMIMWLMLWHLSLCCILHALVHFPGVFILLVCCILVLGNNIHRICFVPLVLICRTHSNIFGESFHFFYILLLPLYVSFCNLNIDWFVSRFLLLDLSVPPPVSLVPSTL